MTITTTYHCSVFEKRFCFLLFLLVAIVTGVRADATVTPTSSFSKTGLASIGQAVGQLLPQNTDNRSKLYGNTLTVTNAIDNLQIILLAGGQTSYLTYNVSNGSITQTITMQDNFPSVTIGNNSNGTYLPSTENTESVSTTFSASTTIDFHLTKGSVLMSESSYQRVKVFKLENYHGYIVACEDGDDNQAASSWDYRDRVFWVTWSDQAYTNAASLANNADNSSTLETYYNKACNVVLTGRTLNRSGVWNTLCLPFALSATQLGYGDCPLNGATVKTLSSTSYDASTGTLTLTFEEATTIAAGKPYIVKWGTAAANLSSPTFSNVTVTTKTTSSVETTYANFVCSFSQVSLTADDRSVLYLGSNSKLYYPSAAVTMGSCRAYFQLKSITAGDKSGSARAFVMNDGETTAISVVSIEDKLNDDEWYDLNGRRYQGLPAQKGLYINNGIKVIIK